MLKHLFMTAAILVALNASSVAQTAGSADTAPTPDVATEPTAALESGQPPQSGRDTGPGAVDAALVREVRQMALEAERKAAKPESPKSQQAIAAERQAIERHREGIFARAEERQQ